MSNTQTNLIERACLINESNYVLSGISHFDHVGTEDLIEALSCCAQIIEANNPAHKYITAHIGKIVKAALDGLQK